MCKPLISKPNGDLKKKTFGSSAATVACPAQVFSTLGVTETFVVCF